MVQSALECMVTLDSIHLLQQFALIIIRCLAHSLPIFHSAAVLCSYVVKISCVMARNDRSMQNV